MSKKGFAELEGNEEMHRAKGYKKRVRWVESEHVLYGRRVIRLEEPMSAHWEKKSPVYELSLPGKYGEVFGYGSKKEVFAFEYALIWKSTTANKLIGALGLKYKPRKKGEELMFRIPPGQVETVLAAIKAIDDPGMAIAIMR